jgi:hypothetical protein
MLWNSEPVISVFVTDHAAACFIATSVLEVVSFPSWERAVCPFLVLQINRLVEIFLKALMLVHNISAGVINCLLGQCQEPVFCGDNSDLLPIRIEN